MKKLLFLFFLLTGTFGHVRADVEPGNNAPGTTTDVLSPSGSQSGTLSPADIIDFYQLTTTADGKLTITVSNLTNEFMYIYLLDNDGSTQLAGTNGYAGSSLTMIRDGLSAGTYYVQVYCTSPTSYTVSSTFLAPVYANDAEPNDNPAQAITLNNNVTVEGHIKFHKNGGTTDDYDYYLFTTAQDGDINISFTNDNNGYTYIYLLDNDGSTILASNNGFAGSGLTFTKTGLAAGTYYIQVYGSGFSAYTLNASLTPNPISNDALTNNSFLAAISFAQNDSTHGHLAYRYNGGSIDENDYYSFYSNGDYNITINFINNTNAYTYIYLYDTDTITVLGTASGFAGSGISMTTNGLGAGTYYIRAYASAGSYSGYTLTNTYTANPFSNDAEPNNTPAQAIATSHNSTDVGHIAYRLPGGSYDNDDYYVFTTTVDGNITLSYVNNTNAYAYVYLIDSDGITVIASTSGYGGSTLTTGANGLAAGTYYARVYGLGGSFAGYQLVKSLTPTPFNNDTEPNNTAGTASILNNNPSKTGHIGHRFNGGSIDYYDYWQLNQLTTDSFKLDINFSNSNYVYVYMVNATNTQIFASSGYGGSYHISFPALAAGVYHVYVYASSYNAYYFSGYYWPCDPAAAVITAGGPTTFCQGGSVNLNLSGVYNNYLWSTGATTGSIAATTSGNYSLTAYDFDGCAHLSNSISVTALPNATWYADSDGDTYGNPGSSQTTCTGAPSGYVADNTDCNDGNAAIHPGAAEICNGLDDDCNGTADDGLTFLVYYTDADGDGYGSSTAGGVSSCTAVAGAVTNNSDCNDGNGTINPAATETCNGLDDDCDGTPDDGLLFSTWYADTDGDSYGQAASTTTACSQPSGYVSNSDDCNDNNAAVHPGITELCNGIDDNCDGSTDEGCSTYTWFADADGDTYGNPGVSTTTQTPTAPAGYVGNNTDCNDNNSAINPAATEICNGTDDDCDGIADDGLTFLTYYTDADGDGYGSSSASGTPSCLPVAGAVTNNSDCNDGNSAIHPAATEICNNLDDNCNGSVDEGLTFTTYYADADGDTYGDATTSVQSCSGAPTGYVSNSTDCNDNSAAVNPGATEVCNSVDDNCDGTIDEGCGGCSAPGPISGPSALCAPTGQQITYSVAAVPGAYSYNWSVPSGTIIVSGQGTTTLVVKWPFSVIHGGLSGTICVNYTAACGTSASSCLPITVQLSVPVRPNSVSGAIKACDGDVAVYTVAAVARATGYNWTVPAGASIISGQGSNIITVQYDNAFLGGSITVSAVNGCGSSPERSKTVARNILKAPASINGLTTGVCGANGVGYTCANVVGAVSYNWTVPAGATIASGQGTTSIVVDFSGSFISGAIIVNAVNGCGGGASRSINVKAVPGQPGPVTGATTHCTGSTAIFDIAAMPGVSIYTWTTPTAFQIQSGQGTKTIHVSMPASPALNKTISVKASNACGSGPARSLTGITVLDCIRATEAAGVIQDLYPNPSQDLVNLTLYMEEASRINLRLLDLSGRVVLSQTAELLQGETTIPVHIQALPQGIYLVEVMTPRGISNIKLVKE